MPNNIEIKAKLRHPDAVANTAKALSDTDLNVLEQRDTFFYAPSCRLKLREFSDGTGELISYLRPDTKDPTGSEYSISSTNNPAELRTVLTMALGVRGEVIKTRRLYISGRTRIHLDDVQGLGHYMELEVVMNAGDSNDGGVQEAQDLMNRLGIEASDLVDQAYIDLLEQHGQGRIT